MAVQRPELRAFELAFALRSNAVRGADCNPHHGPERLSCVEQSCLPRIC